MKVNGYIYDGSTKKRIFFKTPGYSEDVPWYGEYLGNFTHAEPKGQHVLFLADEDGRTMRQKVLGLVVRRGTVCINGEHNEVFNLEAPNRNITWYATRTISGWERFFNKERGSLKIGIQVTNISRDTMHNYANTRVYLQTTVLITHISVFRW
jgi:hypothetical protein